MPKPTPTQNDRTAMGEHVIEKEHDGSQIVGAPQPPPTEGGPPPEGSIDYQRKQMETKKPVDQAGYQNRALHTPAQPPAPEPARDTSRDSD